jgi:alkylhydroperoxidase family enzyme
MIQARLKPLPQPWPEAIAHLLARYPQGPEGPIALFRTLAHSERILRKVAAAGVLDRGSPLTIREREILILRVSSNACCVYEWGIHVISYARKAGLDTVHVADTRAIRPDETLWNESERLLFAVADQLHAECNIDDALWTALNLHWNTQQIMEMLLLCGFYRTISYFNNVLRIAPEPGAPTFHDDPRV